MSTHTFLSSELQIVNLICYTLMTKNVTYDDTGSQVELLYTEFGNAPNDKTWGIGYDVNGMLYYD